MKTIPINFFKLLLFFMLSMLSLAFLAIQFSGCKHDDKSSGTQPSIQTTAGIQWESVPSREGFLLPFLVATPDGTGPYPAIIVLHGCGGLLSDPNAKTLETHFKSWIDFGKSNKVVVIFPDSYNPRGFSEFCKMAPPDDAVCSPAYERTKDVFDVANWIKSQPYIDANRIGILGFSQGAETTLSCIADPSKLNDPRTVTSNGVNYNVPGVVSAPSGIKIKAAVAYYPGTSFYGYYKDQYAPNTPLLIQSAALDPLTSGGQTQNFYTMAVANGANSASGSPIQLVIYDGASHSFDGATSGADAVASEQAFIKTTEWFKKYLSF